MDSTVPNTNSGPTASGASSSSTSPQAFECNICFDMPHEPVVTECGHLYCWRCLFKWMQTKSTCPLCPVCKAKLEKSKVIPVYGRGMQDQKDPRQESVQEERLPPRPRGHRTEAPPQGVNAMPFGVYGVPPTRFGNHHFNGTFSFTVFPSIFGLHFQYPPQAVGNPSAGSTATAGPSGGGGGGVQNPAGGHPQMFFNGEEERNAYSTCLMLLAFLAIICLLFG